MANTWLYKTDKRKITYSSGRCETDIDLVLKVKIQKICEGCESDYMGTSAQTDGYKS